jgi:hypothetical protein
MPRRYAPKGASGIAHTWKSMKMRFGRGRSLLRGLKSAMGFVREP